MGQIHYRIIFLKSINKKQEQAVGLLLFGVPLNSPGVGAGPE
jgi:hypothetical protein